MVTESGAEKFQFLVKLAFEKGAADAKIIPTNKVVVEDRVVLKCKVGCNHYGKTLACPPYTPSAEEFRKIVSEYSYAMFMKFKSKAQAEPEVYMQLGVAETDPAVPKEVKEKAAKFWADWKDDKKKMLDGKAMGYRNLVQSAGDPQVAAALLIIEDNLPKSRVFRRRPSPICRSRRSWSGTAAGGGRD